MNSTPIRSRLRQPNRRTRGPHDPGWQARGFALVVTISLMVLLTLLAVGLLSLSVISLRASTQMEAHAAAQSNARVGLMVALGELQKELGPDGRINSNAGISEQTVPGQRNWVAVYDAWDASQNGRPDPDRQFRRYLVSGNTSTLQSRAAAAVPLSGETVELVAAGTLGTRADADFVRAGTVPVTAGGSGSGGYYAWWIGDENSKAKVNAGRDLPTGLDPTVAALRQADAAPGTGFRMFDELREVTGAGGQLWNMGDDLRQKSVSISSLDLLPGAAPPVSASFHDITTKSYGLLIDVRNRRLKRDLSLYLDRPHNSRLRQPLYTVGTTAAVNFEADAGSATSLNDFSGITMEELWIYYNLYKEVDYRRPATNDDIVGRRPSRFPTLVSANSREAVVADRFFPYKRQVFSQVKYMLSLAAERSAANPNLFDLRIAADPIVVLWNPNNVALEYQHGGYTTVGFTGLPYDAVFTTPNGQVSVPFTSFFDHRNVNLIQGLVGLDHPIVLQPGESRVFSRSGDTGDSLTSGWRYTSGRLLNHANFPKGLAGNANVRLTIRPSVSGGFLNYVTFWFGPRLPATTANPALQAGTLILRGDTNLGDLPTITTPQSITVNNIVAERKIPHMLLSYHMRTETDAKLPSKSWIWNNPSVSFRVAADSSNVSRIVHHMEVQVTPVSTWESPYVQITPGNQAYWGGGVRADFGVPFFTLRSIPLVPMKSIAAFQHSCANGMRRYWKDSSIALPAPGLGRFPSNAEGLDGHRYLNPGGSKLIGNSFAHPLIPRNRAHGTVMASNTQANNPQPESIPVADHAYLANTALWDSWYFSSLAPQTAHPYRSNSRTLQQVFAEFFPDSPTQPHTPLPNARMSPYRSSAEDGLRSLVTANAPAADAHRKLAAHLMVDGAFNVNSTSVKAWRALLGSMRDHAIATLEESSSELTLRNPESNSTPVIGLLNPNGRLASPTASTTEAEQWRGFRTLNDQQIDALANALVVEIKKRGPFLSLADFINRRLGSDTEMARHGPLQAAIEASNLNSAFDQSPRSLGSITGTPFPDAARGSHATGVPGYITQADLLTPLGPVLQARSDTFTIRSHGTSTDANGKILAKAWCEAVVQRVPEYIDPSDRPDVAAASLTSRANQAFGRKFKIVSFRWLNPDEV